MYAVTGTRPDLAHTISLLSQFNSCPNETHLKAAKHVLRYLNRTKDWTLFYPSSKQLPSSEQLYLEGFADADFATCLDTRRSISGYIFRLGRATISWRSRKQVIVTTSTTESEYIALSLACQQLLWIQKAFADFKMPVPSPLPRTTWSTIDQNTSLPMLPARSVWNIFLATSKRTLELLHAQFPTRLFASLLLRHVFR